MVTVQQLQQQGYVQQGDKYVLTKSYNAATKGVQMRQYVAAEAKVQNGQVIEQTRYNNAGSVEEVQRYDASGNLTYKTNREYTNKGGLKSWTETTPQGTRSVDSVREKAKAAKELAKEQGTYQRPVSALEKSKQQTYTYNRDTNRYENRASYIDNKSGLAFQKGTGRIESSDIQRARSAGYSDQQITEANISEGYKERGIERPVATKRPIETLPLNSQAVGAKYESDVPKSDVPLSSSNVGANDVLNAIDQSGYEGSIMPTKKKSFLRSIYPVEVAVGFGKSLIGVQQAKAEFATQTYEETKNKPGSFFDLKGAFAQIKKGFGEGASLSNKPTESKGGKTLAELEKDTDVQTYQNFALGTVGGSLLGGNPGVVAKTLLVAGTAADVAKESAITGGRIAMSKEEREYLASEQGQAKYKAAVAEEQANINILQQISLSTFGASFSDSFQKSVQSRLDRGEITEKEANALIKQRKASNVGTFMQTLAIEGSIELTGRGLFTGLGKIDPKSGTNVIFKQAEQVIAPIAIAEGQISQRADKRELERPLSLTNNPVTEAGISTVAAYGAGKIGGYIASRSITGSKGKARAVNVLADILDPGEFPGDLSADVAGVFRKGTVRVVTPTNVLSSVLSNSNTQNNNGRYKAPIRNPVPSNVQNIVPSNIKNNVNVPITTKSNINIPPSVTNNVFVPSNVNVPSNVPSQVTDNVFVPSNVNVPSNVPNNSLVPSNIPNQVNVPSNVNVPTVTSPFPLFPLGFGGGGGSRGDTRPSLFSRRRQGYQASFAAINFGIRRGKKVKNAFGENVLVEGPKKKGPFSLFGFRPL